MPLEAGVRLGPYEIQSAIGAGGMGEVYRARDTRLDRSVAVKVLPAEFAADAQLRLRFEREAKTISSLNDPHICTLFDVGREDGRDYLVMEFVEGETLADRIERGPLSAGDVLRYGIQMAEALDKAHGQGVVHRDLKPGNIMLTSTGVKLLDFGLAKTGQAGGALTAGTAFATAARPLTQEGTIVGTFQYMAPEQLEGLEADARTDIFALGAVLYEMVTGKRAFEGKTRTSLIAAIVSAEPTPVSQIQPLTPPALEHVIERCLHKEPASRWQSARDIAEELKWISAKGSQIGVAAPVAAHRRNRERLSWSLYPLVALAGAAAVWGVARMRTEPPRLIVSSILPPAKAQFKFGTSGGPLISPDGTRLVYAATVDGVSRLWVRSMSSGSAQPLTGTEEATYPFWSPDSRMIGFFAEGKLKKIDVSGGPAQALCSINGFARGGSWSKDGVIVFSPAISGPLLRVSDAGGEAVALTSVDTRKGQADHRWPMFLPDGRHFLYLAEGVNEAGNQVIAASLDGGETKTILKATSNVAYTNGQLLYWRDRTLVAQHFDVKTLTLGRDVVPIAENVAHTNRNDAMFSVSQHGDLVYQTGSAPTSTQPVWYDLTGKQLRPIGHPSDSRMAALSPDGHRLARAIRDPLKGREDIWLEDLVRGTATRLTFDPTDEFAPVWSPDGTRVAYASNARTAGSVVMKNASGSGAEEVLFSSGGFDIPHGWSPDGKFLCIASIANGRPDWDIWLYSFADRKARVLLQTPFQEAGGPFSSDSRWIAYQSDESGKGQIYVIPVNGSGGKWQISTEGGQRPRFSRDGKHIFYVTPDWKLAVVDVSSHGDTFEAGIPRVLFQTTMYRGAGYNYDVTADGQAVVIDSLLEQEVEAPITLVQNWPSLLKK